MTHPLLMTDEQKETLISLTKNWLGEKGIEYFQDVKQIHGTINATWMEPIVADDIPQYIPRSVYAQEGKSVRRFMKSIDICEGWTDTDIENKWIWLVEESIKTLDK
jgi:hypothetical protein